jgi:hypothetical protein
MLARCHPSRRGLAPAPPAITAKPLRGDEAGVCGDHATRDDITAHRIRISNSEMICVRVLAARCVRGLHQLHPPSKREGAGKAGCRLHPRSCARKAHEWTTGSTGSRRLSLREWFTAYFELSPVTGLFATVALRIDDPSRNPVGPDEAPQDLTPASGRQDHTTSPSATISRQRSCRTSCRPASSGKDGLQRRSSARRPIAHGKTRPAIPLRARRCRVHRIPPRVRDVSRSAPHPGGTGRACNGDLPELLSGIYMMMGLDRILLICPSGCFSSPLVRQGRYLAA